MISKKHANRQIIFRILVAVFFLILILSFLYFFIQKNHQSLSNKFYPNIYIDNINFSKKNLNDAKDFFQEKDKKLQQVKINILYHNKPIATLSAQKINLRTDGSFIITKAYQVGRSPKLIERFYQQLTCLLNLKKYYFNSEIYFDQPVINEIVSQIKEDYEKPAKNALFKFENNRVISFRPEEKGLKILDQDLINQITQVIKELKNQPTSKNVTLYDRVIEPEITLSKANQFGIEELIAEGKSNFTHSIPERIHNIILASSKFHGVLIPKNKIFSFNETVGDISSLSGYKPAYIIKQGKTVLGDGGGVCQVSTTFFRAALNAGLPIIERHAHAYRVSYYENDSQPGFDATVFAPTADVKIINDTPAYILIQTEVDKENNLLFFRFYGKRDNRQVMISKASIYDVQPPPPPLYQEDPTLKKGIVKQIDFPAWGAKTNFTYQVIKSDGQTLVKNFFSNYRPWQAVFLVGTGE
ncbi:MAG: VanW family protein [Microgenomates group bacterium]|nr:VanW family protein [Microgenomates group bacterium]